MSDPDSTFDFLRLHVRKALGDSELYTHSIEVICDKLRSVAPNLDMHQTGKALMAFGIYLASSDECEEVCVHQVGANVAALGDRVLINEELAEHYQL